MCATHCAQYAQTGKYQSRRRRLSTGMIRRSPLITVSNGDWRAMRAGYIRRNASTAFLRVCWNPRGAFLVLSVLCLIGSLAGLTAQTRARTLDLYFIDTEGGQSTLYVGPTGES